VDSGRSALILGIHDRLSVSQAANDVDANSAEQDDPIASTEKHSRRDQHCGPVSGQLYANHPDDKGSGEYVEKRKNNAAT
jgi:hypothetical protein